MDKLSNLIAIIVGILVIIGIIWKFITKMTSSILSKEEEEELLVATVTQSCDVLKILSAPTCVRVGDKDFPENYDPAIAVTYIEALEESLYKKGYVHPQSDTYYQLTTSGKKKAEKLAKKRVNTMSKETVIWKRFPVIYITIIISIIAVIVYIKQCSISKNSLKIQYDTTKPFVVVLEDSIKITNTKANIDFALNEIKVTTDVKFTVKNYNPLPAKELQCKIVFLGYKNPELEFEFDPNGVHYGIYPNSIRTMKRHYVPVANINKDIWVDYLLKKDNKNKVNIVGIDDLEKIESFLHIFVTYKYKSEDIYHSLSINLCRFDFKNKKVDIIPVYNNFY